MTRIIEFNTPTKNGRSYTRDTVKGINLEKHYPVVSHVPQDAMPPPESVLGFAKLSVKDDGVYADIDLTLGSTGISIGYKDKVKATPYGMGTIDAHGTIGEDYKLLGVLLSLEPQA